MNETATAKEMEKRTGFGWKSGLDMTAHIANVSFKGISIMALIWMFGGMAIGGGRVTMDASVFNELWYEIGALIALFVLAAYHEIRVSKMRSTLITAGIFLGIVAFGTLFLAYWLAGVFA